MRLRNYDMPSEMPRLGLVCVFTKETDTAIRQLFELGRALDEAVAHLRRGRLMEVGLKGSDLQMMLMAGGVFHGSESQKFTESLKRKTPGVARRLVRESRFVFGYTHLAEFLFIYHRVIDFLDGPKWAWHFKRPVSPFSVIGGLEEFAEHDHLEGFSGPVLRLDDPESFLETLGHDLFRGMEPDR